MAENKAKTPKSMTKSAVYQDLASATNLSRKQVAEVFEALGQMIRKELGKKGPGVFTIPGLLKLKLRKRPATKAGTRANPFKPGEMMAVKARPASNVVKALPLKSLKESVK
ncbi:MAG TPA: HU family DNA-binding protein [Gemmataceae bacterium]|jgi:nucleoid DNA-binding protein|nr:HU family DNA-binding protein [Gemmataceae bacterium]